MNRVSVAVCLCFLFTGGLGRVCSQDFLRATANNPNDLFQASNFGEGAFGALSVLAATTAAPDQPFLLRADGRATVDLIYDTGFVGSNTLLFPSTTALDGTPQSRQAGRFQMDGTKSQIAFDLQAPQFNRSQAYVELDFNEQSLRLRHAFGQVDVATVGKLSGGQTWTTFTNSNQFPLSIINDGSPAGAVFRRQAILRYTHYLQPGTTAAIAVENPTSTDFVLPAATDVRLQRWPDLIAHLRWQDPSTPFQSVQLAGLARGIGFEDITEDEHLSTGWGVNLSGRFIVSRDNNIQAGIVGGRGLGRYLFGLGSDADQLAAAPDPAGGIDPLASVGTYIGYQHYWSERVMTNIAYGLAHADTTSTMPAAATRTAQNSWANVIVILNPTFAMGLEYHYATRDTHGGGFGDNHRIQLTLSYKPPSKTQGGAASAGAFGFSGDADGYSDEYAAPWLDQL